GDVVAQFNSSWAVRVYRDDLLQIQVDGTAGSAVAGLRDCWTQRRDETPRAVWNPDVPGAVDYYAPWQEVPDEERLDNAFKVEWEMFLLHLAADTPFAHDFREGAKGVQLAELALASWRERRWVDVPDLTGCRALTARSSRTSCGSPSPGRLPRDQFRAASPTPRRTSYAIRSPTAIRCRSRGSTGRPLFPTVGTCGRLAWPWLRPWTRRSAAWGWAGRRRAS